MGPQKSAAEPVEESVELREPELPLTDPAAPPVEGGEPADASCWRCRGSPCGARAEPEAKKKAPCPGLGLFYTLLSAFLFSVASLFVKKVQDVHAVEISAFRCVFQMLFIIPCIIYRNHTAVRKPKPCGEE